MKILDLTAFPVLFRTSVSVGVKPGIKDREVIDIAIREKALLLTEDKDFGRLVFSYNIKGCSVLLIRYEKSDINQIIKNIRKVLAQFYHEKSHYFITITSEKIRIREI